MEYIALFAAPGIAICLYFFYKDIFNKEPRLNLLVSFILGGAAIFPALLFEQSLGPSAIDGSVGGVAIFAYLIVAFSEEASKFIGFRLYSYNQKSFDEPFDGIVYAVMISMGFATAENIKYLIDTPPGSELQLGLLRMFTAVPGHATFAIIMGYFAGKAKFNSKNSLSLLITGLVGAIFFHGTYDFFLFITQPQFSFIGREEGNQILAAGALISFIVSIILCRKLIKRHRKISKEMFNPKNPPPPPSA
jgi:RsiW-degrading membrane proteinase PrsW (M82 family)